MLSNNLFIFLSSLRNNKNRSMPEILEVIPKFY